MSQESISSIEQLVAAREARGISVEDMVRQLKLAPRQLRALEEGDWQALPGLAFTRAVLRSYGRALAVDVDPLVGSMAPSLPEADLKPASTLHQPMPARSMLGFGSGGGGNRLAWFVLIVLAVVALALFFGGESNLSNVRSWLSEFRASTGDGSAQKADAPAGTEVTGTVGGQAAPVGMRGATDSGASTESTTSRATASVAPAQRPPEAARSAATGLDARGDAAPKAGEAVAGAAGSPASGSVAGLTGPTAATGAPKPTGAPPAKPEPASGAAVQASSAAPADAKPDASAAGRRAVKLVFQRDSWVEARDADGKVLFTGTQKAGTEHEFTAGGPVSMIIGNAEFVRAEVDGKPFDLVPHTRAAIARVTLR